MSAAKKTVKGPPDMDAYRAELKAAAAVYIDQGLPVTVCNGKNPQRVMGKDWQSQSLTAEEAANLIDKAETPTIGLMQGSFIDIEYDSLEENAAMLELFDQEIPDTPHYESSRGFHYLFTMPDELRKTQSGQIKFRDSRGREVTARVGAGAKASHSIAPPSWHATLVDTDKDEWKWTGERYTWQVELGDQPLAALPNHVIQKLLAAHDSRTHRPASARGVQSDHLGAKVHDEALDAMLSATGRIEDKNDGSKRLLVCACKAVEFDCIDDQAVATVRAYAQDRPFPSEWSDKEITQRIRDAEAIVKRGDKAHFRNFRVETWENEKGKKIRRNVSLTMSEVITELNQFTGDFPRRVGNGVFADDPKHGIAELATVDGLFGWIQRYRRVDWSRASGMVGRGELFAELKRTSTEHVAIETLPHFPAMPGHYYSLACPQPRPGDGKTLDAFLDFFCPATDSDRQLLLAAIVTPFWGGGAGQRPAFVFTSTAGRGVGKSVCAQFIAEIGGGALSSSPNEDMGSLMPRLLSAEGKKKRIVLLDNIKTDKVSSGQLEGLITSTEISGRQLYVGEGKRPNLLTVMMTMNGPALSRDMAQRCVMIELAPHTHDGNWYERCQHFVDENRIAIIADIRAFFEREEQAVECDRWSNWDLEVLSRLPEPAAAQRLILRRRADADADSDEALLFEEFVESQISRLVPGADSLCVRVPNDRMNEWHRLEFPEKRQGKRAALTWLRQMITEGQITRLSVDPSHTHGRGFLFSGPNYHERAGDNIDNTLVDLRGPVAA